MHIKEKIYLDYEDLNREGSITIVAFGDSVTHGAVAPNEMNFEDVYWNRLRKKIQNVRSYVPVNVINAGIGGTTAFESVMRLESQVLCHKPDLVIVCFGLNDVNRELSEYVEALETIFIKCKESGADVIFMTPNMLNTYVADDTLERLREYAFVTAEYQNSGKMDLYMREAVRVATEAGVTVCDCYSQWKKLSETKDTTMLLANRINHPVSEMHELFAEMLFDCIFDDGIDTVSNNESTMYRG